MSQQLVAKPQGIISEPNKVGQFPPGAFARATNAAIRSFGCVEQVPKWSFLRQLNTPGFPLTGGVYALSEGPLTVFVFSRSGFWQVNYKWFNESTGSISTGLVPLGSPWDTTITDDMRTGMLIMRNRLIITAADRVFCLDFVADTSGNLSSVKGPRRCGVQQPGIVDRFPSNTADADGGMLRSNTHLTAGVVLRLVHPDGYEILSPISMLGDYSNLSTTLAEYQSGWQVSYFANTIGGPGNKARLDVYRSRAQSTGYDSIGNKYLPIACGANLFLSKSKEVSLGSTGDTVYDSTPEKALGEALLTNTAKEGATAIPLPPVPAKTCAVFKGHAFYANRIDPAKVTILSPYFWGTIPAAAPTAFQFNGIGEHVYLAATATNANPTATGLANTDGVVVGQALFYYRTDTGALVMTGQVLSKTGTTVTSTVNSSYSGSVTVIAEDVIEFNGTRYRVGTSASDFVANVLNVTSNPDFDFYCTALEPQSAVASSSAYPSFSPTGGLTIRMRTNGNITLRATHGAKYSPELPDITSTVLTISPTPQPNGYSWSENNEPENCPPSNYGFSGQGDIYRVIATRDCLWFFCSDGLFRLSGNGGDVGDGYDWVLDPVDPGLVIMNPQAACAHREYVYAYTNRGFVSISSEGVVRELSDGRINPTSASTTGKLPNRTWTRIATNGANDGTVWLEADRINDEIWLRTGLWETNPKQIWVYNTKTDTFCVRIPTLFNPREIPTLGVYNVKTQEMELVFANRDGIYISTNDDDDLEEMSLGMQPIFGSGASAPHTVKHWQNIQVSFKTPQPSDNVLVTLRGSNSFGAQTSLFLPVVIGQPNDESARVSFVLSRNFPAISNMCAFTLFVSEHSSDAPVTVEAISVNYVNFTEDRWRR